MYCYLEIDGGDLVESANSSYIPPVNPKLRTVRNSWILKARELFHAGDSATTIRDALIGMAGVGHVYVWIG